MRILQAIQGLIQTSRAKGEATFAYLVDAIVGGSDELRPADVLDALDRLGLSYAELESACRAEVQRRHLGDRAEAGRLADQELAGIPARIKAELDALGRGYQALDAEHGPRLAALRQRQEHLQRVRSAGRDAANALREQAAPELKERKAQIGEERRRITERREYLHEAQLINKGNLGRLQQQLEDAEPERVSALEARLAQIKRERDDLDGRDRELLEEYGRLDAATFDRN